MSDTMEPILDAIALKGVLLNLQIRSWRGRKKLRAEELGLDPLKIDLQLFSLGQKRLIPKDVLQPFALIEGQAHARVESSSFPFLHGLARYVPNQNLEFLLDRLKELKAAFETETQRFVSQYAAIRVQSLAQWKRAAESLTDDPFSVMAAIDDAFPPVGELINHFAFRWQLFQVTAPENLRVELFDQAESEAVLAARKRASSEARESIRQNVELFVQECVTALRSETAGLCDEMLTTIRVSGSVNQKTLNRLTGFIDRFRSLNFVQDEELEARLLQVRAEILGQDARGYRETPGARDVLVNGLRSLRDDARNLALQDNRELVERFGELGRRKFAEVS